jgi:hypothetical protein
MHGALSLPDNTPKLDLNIGNIHRSAVRLSEKNSLISISYFALIQDKSFIFGCKTEANLVFPARFSRLIRSARAFRMQRMKSRNL